METVSSETAPLQTSITKRSRHWYSFSLRTLLIFVTLMCLVIWMIPGERQRRACEQIKTNGGYYRLKKNTHGTELLVGRNNEPYSYLNDMEWYECYFYKIEKIKIDNDLDIRDWSGFPYLTSLAVSDERGIGNFDFVLQDPSLSNAITDLNISARGLGYFNLGMLSNYKRLKKLKITGAYFTMDELFQIQSLSQLRNLELNILFTVDPQSSDDQSKMQEIVDTLKKKIPKVKIRYKDHDYE